MSLFAQDTVAAAWRQLIQLREEASRLRQTQWNIRAASAVSDANHYGALVCLPSVDGTLRAAPPIETTKAQPSSKIEEALARHQVVEALAQILYIKNSHKRQREWLRVAWYWLQYQNIVGARLLMEKLTLPQLQEEKLLLEAEILRQQGKNNKARCYLEAIEPNLRRYTFQRARNADQLLFLTRGMLLKAALWTPSQMKSLLFEQAEFLCKHPGALQEFYQALPNDLQDVFLGSQKSDVYLYIKEAFAFAKISLRCAKIKKIFAKRAAPPTRALTPEDAYWLGASKQLQCVPDAQLRPFFDAGLSTRDDHHSTEALFRASKREVEDAVLQNKPSDKIKARLECLQNLQTSKVDRWLEALFMVKHSDLDVALFDVMLHRNAKRAKALFFENFLRLTKRCSIPDWQHKFWQRQLRIENGLYSLQSAAKEALGADGRPWLAALLQRWWQRFGQEPSSETMEMLKKSLASLRPHEKRQLIAMGPKKSAALFIQNGEALTEKIFAMPQDELLSCLLKSPETLQMARCFAPTPAPFTWSEDRWRDTLRRLQRDITTRDDVLLRDFMQRLTGHRASLAKAFVGGASPTQTFSKSIMLEEDLSIRYLHKARDIFSFLRFADAVTCCFSSGAHKGEYHNQQWIFQLWKDPLSFCFSIDERRSDGTQMPFGFVFGSFGAQKNAPVLLLNGLYLKRQKQALRENILRTIEENFCKPLGLQKIGVANRFAGTGALPEDYKQETQTVTRLRALRGANGLRVQYVYDDICNGTNQSIDAHLHWKQLA